MSSSPTLAPAGSSVYSSSSMYVGDGTWDAQRNTFLLPNLMGLNFNTMRYNGMGNRFRELAGYGSLIRTHGIIAAIAFLAVVPAAILIARFYTRNPRWALRLHIWLQILTVLLTTVVFVLGYIAVGPARSFTNPHHGIGLAIYVMVLFQFISGWWIHRREKGRQRLHIPLRLMTHQWLGRCIALLGLAQVPLGLTLWGSPKALFVLYALAVFALVITYFALSYVREKHWSSDYGSGYSYDTESVVDERRDHSRLGGLARAGAAGAGLAALSSRFRRRSDSRAHPEVVASRRHSGSYVEDEKYSQHGKDPDRKSGWGDRLLKIGAVAGVAALAKRVYDRRNRKDRDSDDGHYGPPLGGATELSEDSMEEVRPPPGRRHRPLAGAPVASGRPLSGAPIASGRIPSGPLPGGPLPSGPLPSRQHPLNQPLHHRRSTSSVSYSSYSYMTDEGSPRKGHGLRDAVAGLGAIGLARNIFKKRRERKEQRRIDALRQQEIEEERLARANGNRYTGDGLPPRGEGRNSITANAANTGPPRNPGRPPPTAAGTLPAGVLGAAAGAAAGAAVTDHNRNRPTMAGGIPSQPPPGQPIPMPPMPPDHQGILHQDSSGSEAYTSTVGARNRRRPSIHDKAREGLEDIAAGVAAAEAAETVDRRLRDRSNRRNSASGEGSVASPPVSVKVKMHSDGRHVTLRRLPEQEAAAEREARRRSKDRPGRRRRGESESTLSGTDNGRGERWRRTDALERQQAEEMRRAQTAPIPVQPPAAPAPPPPTQSNVPAYLPIPLPPPPPIPPGGLGPPPNARPTSAGLGPSPPQGPAGSVGSPGTYDGTATEASDYAENRRRRRAERARAKIAREGGRGVDFE